MNPIPEEIRSKILDTRLILLVVGINLAGTAFGFYYYMPQFMDTAVDQWLLVADSPLATLFMSASLLFYWRNTSSSLVDVLAFIGNLKYGLWTVFVLIFYFETFWKINSAPMYCFLLLSHLAMAIQAFLILEYGEFELRTFLIGASSFLVNDFVDYYQQLHPRLFTELNYFWNPASITAVILTISAILLYLQLVGPGLRRLSDHLQRFE